jgi:sigma-B regulation protein RsbU (phosphoserine phosphatase)
LGKTDFDLFPRELAEKYHQDDQVVMNQNKHFETVEEHQPPEGEKIYVQVVKTPLHDAEKNIIGLQGIFWDISERRRAEEQVRLASAELARSREALRKKNAEMEDDLKMAREIQQTMLPQQFPTFPKSADPRDSRFRFSYRYLPTGTVGGDYFNVLSLSDTEAGVFICDVMGHGVRSALVAAMVRALVEEIKPLSGDPGKLLSQLNRDLCAILKQTGSPTLITAFYLTVDSITGRTRYANAGHPKPFVIHPHSGKVELLANQASKKSNPALGLFADAQYPTSESQLSPGDLVMLFTDGLYEVEGANGEIYTHEMLVEAVNRRSKMPASELFDTLLAEIKAYAQGADFVDDVCLVGMEVAEVK